MRAILARQVLRSRNRAEVRFRNHRAFTPVRMSKNYSLPTGTGLTQITFLSMKNRRFGNRDMPPFRTRGSSLKLW
jgi:hypothetical protein